MRSPIRTTRLALESLDARIVPAATRLDLTHHNAQVAAGGALIRQTDAQPAKGFDTFVRLDSGNVEEGYNTDARPLQFDEKSGRSATHSLTLGQVPQVTVQGNTYREFVLDLREAGSKLSLDEVQIFLGDTGNLRGYNAKADTLAGRSAAFDLDSGGDVSVIADGRTSKGHGFGDLTLLVPESAFAGASAGTYVYLYSKLGATAGARANGDAESWAVSLTAATPTPTPTPTPDPTPTPAPTPDATGSLSGHLLYDDGSGTLNPIVNAKITLTNSSGATVTATTDATGAYSFTGLAAGTYTVAVTTIPQAFAYLPAPDSVGSAGGTSSGNDKFTVDLGAGVNGTDYDFIEMLGG